MSEIAQLILPAAAGGLLGVVFFGGLWLTVSHGLRTERPALWFTASLFARMTIALGGFYRISAGEWTRLAACLFGFVAARFILTRLMEARHSFKESGLAP